MNSPKKIGLMACTGIVAGNMMGSDIALLPSNLASIGSVALFGWAIALVGALALAYVFARLSTVNPQSGGPVAYAGEVSPAFGFQTGVLYYLNFPKNLHSNTGTGDYFPKKVISS